MNDESRLREKIREALRDGRLPDRRPDSTWGGMGVGANCAICEARVTCDEVEYEIEFAQDREGSGPAVYHVHPGCFTAWDLARQSRELARRGTLVEHPHTRSSREGLPDRVDEPKIVGHGGAADEPGRR